MPENLPKKSNILSKRTLVNSNIIRVVGFLSILALYTVFLSPKVENVFVENIASFLRKSSVVEVNSLTPIFDMHVYAGEYNFSSVGGLAGQTGRTKFFTLDPRIVAMSKFLNDYQSPMAQHAELFIAEADSYGLDWRLVVGISGVESAFGNLIPRGSHNAWGWRGRNPEPRGWSMFENWQEAIIHITERMALGYGTDLTPYDIESTYCPPCGATGLNLWANGVNRFMNELEYYVNNLESL